jgi:hypothetical protein
MSKRRPVGIKKAVAIYWKLENAQRTKNSIVIKKAIDYSVNILKKHFNF